MTGPHSFQNFPFETGMDKAREKRTKTFKGVRCASLMVQLAPSPQSQPPEIIGGCLASLLG